MIKKRKYYVSNIFSVEILDERADTRTPSVAEAKELTVVIKNEHKALERFLIDFLQFEKTERETDDGMYDGVMSRNSTM